LVSPEHVPAGTWEFEHHAKTFGSQARFGYKDFVPLLTAGKAA